MPINLQRDGYTHEQVKEMLHAEKGIRQIRFRYDLLDKNDNFISELDTVEGGSIEFSSFSDIKRTAKIKMREESYTQETYMTWGDLGGMSMGEIYDKFGGGS